MPPSGTSCLTIAALNPVAQMTYEVRASGTCSKKLVFVEVRGLQRFTSVTPPTGMAPLPSPDGSSIQQFVGCVAANTPFLFTIQAVAGLHPGTPFTVVYTFSDGSIVKEVVTPGSL